MAKGIKKGKKRKCTDGSLIRTRVTDGQFGKALEHFVGSGPLPRNVVTLLKLSPTFMKMACKLDGKYISLNSSRYSVEKWFSDVDDDGVFLSGRFKVSRRRIDFESANVKEGEGSMFIPANSPDLPVHVSWDVILIVTTGLRTKALTKSGLLIESIAHETTHAFKRVSRKTSEPSGKMKQDEMARLIRGGIDDEIATRNTEKKIVEEIRKRAKSFKKFEPTPTAKNRFEVERDFFPTRLKRTYLEHFVIETLRQRAISDEGLSFDEVRKINIKVEKDPLKALARPPVSGYERLTVILRAIDVSWRSFLKQHSDDDADFEEAKERVLQHHARAFFNRFFDDVTIDYTTHPKLTIILFVLDPKTAPKSFPPPVPLPSPIPGQFYQFKGGDGLFKVAGKAFGLRAGAQRAKAAQIINMSKYNRRFWTKTPKSERQWFPDGRISFSKRFSSDLLRQFQAKSKAPRGGSYAMIWIPPDEGVEPY